MRKILAAAVVSVSMIGPWATILFAQDPALPDPIGTLTLEGSYEIGGAVHPLRLELAGFNPVAVGNCREIADTTKAALRDALVADIKTILERHYGAPPDAWSINFRCRATIWEETGPLALP